ncbi:MAG: HK97 gp10 family phage protein [Planctomycetota bacterium]
MAKQQAFVTGDEELDRVLKGLPAKLQKKYMRKATRDASKKVLQRFRDNVPTETGALRDTAKVRAVKRSRGKTGHMVHIDREKLILERAARGGKIGFDPKRKEPFFYPAVLEFDPTGDKPMRTALYESENATRTEIIKQVKQMANDAAIDGATR